MNIPEVSSLFTQVSTNGGLSIADAVEVKAYTETTGIKWEYDWLTKNGCKNNGGPKKMDGQSLKTTGGHDYDVMAVTCQDAKKINYYFMIDNFFGKN